MAITISLMGCRWMIATVMQDQQHHSCSGMAEAYCSSSSSIKIPVLHTLLGCMSVGQASLINTLHSHSLSLHRAIRLGKVKRPSLLPYPTQAEGNSQEIQALYCSMRTTRRDCKRNDMVPTPGNHQVRIRCLCSGSLRMEGLPSSRWTSRMSPCQRTSKLLLVCMNRQREGGMVIMYGDGDIHLP